MFCTSAQKWDKKMIQLYNKDKNKSVMIWTCFENDSQKSDLVFMSDDSEAKQKKVTSAVYLKVLEEQMTTLWESDLIYMQNEASIHTACIIKKWLADNKIEMIDWSLYFLNLNSIEHIWRHLKEWIHEHYSELETLISSDKMIKKHMIEILQEVWAHLNDEFLKKLIESMKKQIKTVIKTDDWHTKY